MSLLNWVEKAIEYTIRAGADEAHAWLGRSTSMRVEMEMDTISKCSWNRRVRLGITAIVDKKMGSVTVQRLTENDIRKAAETAYRLARVANRNDKWLGLPPPKPYVQPVDIYDTKIVELEPDQLVEYAKYVMDSVKEYDKRVAIMQGMISTSWGESYVGNSNGILGEDKGTGISAYIVTVAREASRIGSFAIEDMSSRKLDVDFTQMAREGARRAVESLDTRPVRSFRGPIVFDYNVSSHIFRALASAYNGDNVWRKSSPLGDKLSESIAVEDLTIVDDGLLPGGIGTSKFDGEGSPRRTTTIIEKGILKNFINNTFTARILNMEPTGNASSLLGVAPSNIVVKPGDMSVDEILEGIKTGLFVSRFSGSIRFQDGVVSGTVKQAHLIERGEKVYSVGECMISGNLYTWLKNITGMSRDVKRKGETIIPIIKIENINIISKT